MFKTMTSVMNLKSNPKAVDIQKIPSYVFCRWLSGNPHTISAANVFNLYSDIPIENQYQMIRTAFGGKIGYIPYPKQQSVNTTNAIMYLSEHFKVSLEKAKEYLEYIDKDELKEIVKIYEAYDLKR